MKISIDRKWCKGCGLCVKICKKGVLEFGDMRSASGYLMPQVKKPESCISCMMCERICPDLCIDVEKDQQ